MCAGVKTERMPRGAQTLSSSLSDHGHRGFAGSSVALPFGGLPLVEVGVRSTWEGPGVSSSPDLGENHWLQKRSPGGVIPVAW